MRGDGDAVLRAQCLLRAHAAGLSGDGALAFPAPGAGADVACRPAGLTPIVVEVPAALRSDLSEKMQKLLDEHGGVWGERGSLATFGAREEAPVEAPAAAEAVDQEAAAQQAPGAAPVEAVVDLWAAEADDEAAAPVNPAVNRHLLNWPSHSLEAALAIIDNVQAKSGILQTFFVFYREDETPLKMTVSDTDSLYGLPAAIVDKVWYHFQDVADATSGVAKILQSEIIVAVTVMVSNSMKIFSWKARRAKLHSARQQDEAFTDAITACGVHIKNTCREQFFLNEEPVSNLIYKFVQSLAFSNHRRVFKAALRRVLLELPVDETQPPLLARSSNLARMTHILPDAPDTDVRKTEILMHFPGAWGRGHLRWYKWSVESEEETLSRLIGMRTESSASKSEIQLTYFHLLTLPRPMPIMTNRHPLKMINPSRLVTVTATSACRRPSTRPPTSREHLRMITFRSLAMSSAATPVS
ncbi:unnamed protein product [Prorocentrum cordatum]|uniref:Uncharacterized protein n=1 Tax=Prorocentrum cordatum TaxID=2364126 RepID=A0ABN9PJN3_9DINO|nr:unnamed protein product [Polarella glacialis]